MFVRVSIGGGRDVRVCGKGESFVVSWGGGVKCIR